MWSSLDPEILRLRLLSRPQFLQIIQQTYPELANAAVHNPEEFKRLVQNMYFDRNYLEIQRQREISALNADPLNVEAQARIEEIIRQEAVMENLENAMEYHPESFGRAFVDSGAQNTIMSPSCAKACGITHLIDKRFSGIAKGVGTASIIGRIHSAQIKVGPLFLACSFTIIEGKDIDILFGLDMLRSHQACIDLKRNALVINDALIPFLSEADLPDNAKMETIYLSEAANHDKEQTKADDTQKQSRSRDNSNVLAQSTYKGQSESKYHEEDIRQLQALGFSKEEALQALEAADGDVSMAANFLF